MKFSKVQGRLTNNLFLWKLEAFTLALEVQFVSAPVFGGLELSTIRFCISCSLYKYNIKNYY